MASTDILKTLIDANIKENGQQQITGNVLNHVLNKMVDLIEENRGFTEEEKAELNEQLTELSEEIGKKADMDGSYSELTAGDLYGHGESVPAEFSFRASGGKSIKDGTAYIKEVYGNAVVWNQKLKKDRTIFTSYGIEVTKNGDGSYTLNGTPTQDAWIGIEEANMPIPSGHIWLLIGCPNGGDKSTYCLWDSQGAIQDVGAGQIKKIDQALLSIRIMVRKDFECVNLIFRPRLIDLTQMFGSGYEPTTIEEFYKLLPSNIDLNAYNEGEVIPFTAEGIKSVGDNAWDEEWELGNIDGNTGELISGNFVRSKNPIPIIGGEEYWCNKRALLAYNGLFCYDREGAYIQRVDSKTGYYTLPTNAAFIRFRMSSDYGTTYNHDIMITLVHSGWKAEVDNTYKPYWADTLLLDSRIKEAFPNGMMPWDKVYNKDGKGYIVKGSGSVDMGDLSWSAYTSADNVFFAVLQGKQLEIGYKANMISPLYEYAVRGIAELEDMQMRGLTSATNVYFKNSQYTDAASFKAAMQGVKLYYELAEPTILEYDTPFQLDYKVADFGTEEIIGDAPSAPFKGRTIYQFNAVDQIRENYNEIEKIKAALAKAGITIDL